MRQRPSDIILGARLSSRMLQGTPQGWNPLFIFTDPECHGPSRDATAARTHPLRHRRQGNLAMQVRAVQESALTATARTTSRKAKKPASCTGTTTPGSVMKYGTTFRAFARS